MKAQPEEDERGSLLARGWVQGLVLFVASIVAFGTAVGGTLVWDDYLVIGNASAQRGLLRIFTANLFGTPAGEGTKYYRPLVGLSYWVDVKVFEAAPNVGMHVVNLVWHATAAVLLLRLLRRLTRAPGTKLDIAGAACFVAVLAWSMMPGKAENVAWITGRGDLMGTVFVLAGIELASLFRAAGARAASVAAGTALALLCKESMVAAPAIVAGVALVETLDDGKPTGWWPHLKRSVWRPEVAASLGLALAYLALRAALLPISTGAAARFEWITTVDRIAIFFETSGLALAAMATPWRAQLLRSPIGFAADGTLVHDLPAMLALGAAGWVLALVLAWKKPPWRGPLAIGFGTFLPVSNVILIPLEARLSDRYLYLPSVGLCLGLAMGIATLRPTARAWGSAAAVLAVALLLGARTRSRSALFISSDALFQAEVRDGNRALAVLSNGAFAAAEARRYRDARDLHRKLYERYGELGYETGFTALEAALRNQVRATEETFQPSVVSYEQLARALMGRRDETVVIELEDDKRFTVRTGAAPVVEYYGRYGFELRGFFARILARRGDPDGLAIARQQAKDCDECNDVLIMSADVALAAASPDDAERWATAARAATPRRALLIELAQVERRLLASPSPFGPALASFAGGGFTKACREGVAAGPLADGPKELRAAIGSACVLAPDMKQATAIAGSDITRLETAASPLRYDDAARAELAIAAAGAAP